MLRTKKAECQDQVITYLTPALDFRLNTGLGLKTHAVCALRGLRQVLLQRFALSSPAPSAADGAEQHGNPVPGPESILQLLGVWGPA